MKTLSSKRRLMRVPGGKLTVTLVPCSYPLDGVPLRPACGRDLKCDA